MQLIKPLIVLCTFIAITAVNHEISVPQTSTIDQTTFLQNKQIYSSKKSKKQFDKPGEAAAWIAEGLTTPKGFTPAQLNLQYQAEIKAAKASKNNQNLPALAFEELGPGVFGGRIRGFVMHPEREGHLLAGGVSGGVWKSTDDGQSWEAKTDFLENIAIGSMLIDPDNPEKVYLGTGEGFFNFDAARGFGMFVSEDFGETWQRFGATTGSDFHYVNRMVKIPNSNELLAATSTGIWKTDNNGQQWNEVSGVNVTGRGFTDLQINPSNPNHLLAYHFGNENTATVNFNVNAPANLAGNYDAIPASFGPSINTNVIAGELLLVQDIVSPGRDGCDRMISDLTDKIALIQRGSCNFTQKVLNAQDAGAIAVVVYQNSNEAPFTMGGTAENINIPALMIAKNDGDRFIESGTTVNVSINASDQLSLERYILLTEDGGDAWSKLDNNGLPELDVLRMEIGFGSDGKTYIAASKDAEDLENGGTNGTIGLYRSIGSDNQNFEKTASNTNFIERQGWYDMAIAVNPSDSDHVIMGAIDLYSTQNGGDFIDRNTFWFSPPGFTDRYIHADHHGYFFSPFNTEHIYVVNDGGVAKSEDGGDSWMALNNGLNISQSYGIDVSPDGSQVISGTQDNGAKLYFGDEQTWLPWAGGDGGYSGWDQQQPQFIYGSFPNGEIYGSNDGGLSIQRMELPDTEGARFIQPFVLDEKNGNRLLVGTDKVYFTNNARSLASATWTDLTGSINGTGVSALAFNPHQSNVAYAGMVTSDALGTNQIIRISGLGSTNTVTDIGPPNSLGVDGTVVTDIKVDTFDTSGNTVYATFGGYFSNRILRTTDGGNSWTSISNDLPNMPLWQVINDPTDANVLYVGSELGLWVGTQSSNTYNWEQFDYGSAFTRVIDLVWRNDALYIGTHGRGTFKATKAAIEVELVKFIADNSSCDTDNFLDRGEAGELIVALTNQSARNFDSVNVSFDLPGVIGFTNANQTIALDGFAAQQISIPVELDAGAACLADLNVPVSVDTGDLTYETSISLTTAANQAFTTSTTFSDDAETNDSQLKSVLAFGNDGWIRVSDNVNSGDSSWFTTNENAYSDKSLITPWLTFDAGGNVIRFAMSYDTEGDTSQYWDGLVLEMRLKGSDLWFDIGHLSSVPYDGQLNTNNTAQAQFAWSGTQLEWRDASINLGSEYAGKTAQIRWRMVSDTNTAQEGFWLDDITISRVIAPASLTCDECISDANSLVPNRGPWYDPARDGHGFIIESFGRDMLFYTMFYTFDDQGNPEWFNSLTTLENGVLNPEFAAGTINGFTYNTDVNPAEVDPLILDTQLDGRLTINFNNAEIRNDPACLDGTPRNLDFAALATWKLDDVTRSWCIEPLVANKNRPDHDFGTGWWAGPNDNGWGYSLAQVNDLMIAYIFYYDAEGKPRWSTGFKEGFKAGQDITVPMADVFGYGRTQSLVERSFVPNGSITLNLSNTFRDLDTDGTTSIDITYQGAEGGRWLRNNSKIMNLLQEH
ncbi:hypothetical protein OS175_00905 [Marinicella sp. S1101]|uniref:PA domain-containing protein n=1 Tax=Marinicella marina TaxID=2996016 RepID=UPI0022608702|nr:PA domain-containing protein [Marinicella marina]MCX7552422.1 hypothetical protein [Marinicella marina]MDJ1139297.1 hypothetical protein [Marinicella marina]